MTDLADKLEEGNYKIVFGLQPKQIEIIERRLKVFPNAIYNTTIWEDIGKEIGWCALTAALYYFEYLEEKRSAKSS